MGLLTTNLAWTVLEREWCRDWSELPPAVDEGHWQVHHAQLWECGRLHTSLGQPRTERGEKQASLRNVLSVRYGKVDDYLSRDLKDLGEVTSGKELAVGKRE